jgi:hypothetical protein
MAKKLSRDQIQKQKQVQRRKMEQSQIERRGRLEQGQASLEEWLANPEWRYEEESVEEMYFDPDQLEEGETPERAIHRHATWLAHDYYVNKRGVPVETIQSDVEIQREMIALYLLFSNLLGSLRCTPGILIHPQHGVYLYIQVVISLMRSPLWTQHSFLDAVPLLRRYWQECPKFYPKFDPAVAAMHLQILEKPEALMAEVEQLLPMMKKDLESATETTDQPGN